MAANTRAKAAGYGANDEVLSSEFETVQTQAAQAPNRTNSFSGWRSVPLIVCANGNWETDDNGKIYMTDVAVPRRVNIPLTDLPNGQILEAVRLWILPAAGHGAQPANMPILRVFKRPASLVANATLVGDATAAWGSIAAYEAGEGLDVTGLNETIDLDSNSYFAQFVNEHGGNAVAGLSLCGIDLNVTVNTGYSGQDWTIWRKDA